MLLEDGVLEGVDTGDGGERLQDAALVLAEFVVAVAGTQLGEGVEAVTGHRVEEEELRATLRLLGQRRQRRPLESRDLQRREAAGSP